MWLLRIFKLGISDLFKDVKKAFGMWGRLLFTLVVNSVGIGLLVSLVIVLLITLSKMVGG